MWAVCIVGGAILTALTGIFFRANPLHIGLWGMVALLLPYTVFTQFCFAYGFNRSPVFFVAWFLGTGVCAISASLASLYAFHETIRASQLIAILMILIGAGILAKGS